MQWTTTNNQRWTLRWSSYQLTIEKVPFSSSWSATVMGPTAFVTCRFPDWEAAVTWCMGQVSAPSTPAAMVG